MARRGDLVSIYGRDWPPVDDPGPENSPTIDELDGKRDEKTDTRAVKEGGGGLSDARLADRVAVDVLEGRFCWARGLGWLQWDGRRWADVPEAAPVDAVRRYFIRWHGKAAGRGADTTLLKALSGLLSRTKISNVVALAKGIVMVDPGTFDQQPDLLNVGNGVVDLRNGELRDHDPALLLTKLTPVHYAPGATHLDWEAAVAALPGEVADWMQVRFGQAATGHMTPDDVMPVCQGGGSNGKSTLLGSINAALGDHAVTVPERVLMSNPGDHPTELMTLFGARLALLEETPEARHLSVKRLKDTVGTAPMTARRIRENPVTWDPTHSLMLTTNYTPRVDETDHGTWRRLALVRFPYTFTESDAAVRSVHQRPGDPALRDRLKAGLDEQHAAVLAWIVAGAVRWYAAGRVMPPAPAQVKRDTAAWRAEADHIFSYIRDRLTFDGMAMVLTTDLFEDFTAWLSERGNKPWSDQTFTARFGGHSEAEAHNVTKRRVNKAVGLDRRPGSLTSTPASKLRVWDGVRFSTDSDPDDEPASVTKPQVDRVGPGSKMNTHAYSNLKVNQLPRSNLVQDSPQDENQEASQHCSACGAVLSEMRADYGKSTCVDCERGVSS